MKVASIIENELDKSREPWNKCELACIIDKHKSTISRFFDGGNLDFKSILSIIREKTPHIEERAMKVACNEISGKTNKLMALEYSSTGRDFETMLKLINDLKKGNRNIEKEWAEVYRISYLYQNGLKNSIKENIELKKELLSLEIETVEMRAFAKLIEANLSYMVGNVRGLLWLTKDAEDFIKDISNEYIKESFEIRLSELYTRIHLHLFADTKKARKYAEQVIKSNINDAFKVHSYNYMAFSYLFEDYDKTIHYLEIYRDVLAKSGRQDAAEIAESDDIAFVKILWGRDLKGVNLNLEEEKSHYEARWGDKEKAKLIIDKEIKKNGETPFKLFFKGLAYESADILIASMVKFLSTGNKYFATAVLKELLKSYESVGKTAKIMYDNHTIIEGEKCS